MEDGVLDVVIQRDEDALAHLSQRIKELEKEKEELEAFNYTVAHDLYAPLMRIEGYGELLLKECAKALDGPCEGYLGRVVRAAQQAKSLLNDLLNLSRATHSELLCEEVDIGLMAQNIVDDYCEAEPLREIRFKTTPGLIVCADPVLMRLVLMNLLGNAWKYTAIREDACIELGTQSSPEGYIYYVRDNGVGFDPQAANQLFVAFRRLGCPTGVEGSGLGLAIVARAIARHGGKVWAEGVLGGGATFNFLLPAR